MEKSHSKWFTGSIVVIIVAVCSFLVIGYPFRANNALKFSSVTVTNDTALGPMAVFEVTNTSAVGIAFIPRGWQFKSGGHDWLDMPHHSGYLSVPPYGGTNFNILLPLTNAVWRLPVAWSYEQADKFEYLRGNVHANLYFNWQNITHGRSMRYYNSMMGSSYMVYSPEITN